MLTETEQSRAWDRTVLAEHEQSDKVREQQGNEDFWRPLVQRFTPRSPEDEEDPAVAAVAPFLSAETTLIDVGAGGGRLAIPLAAKCREITAVEPSDAMVEQLRSLIDERKLSNVRLVQATWDEAEVASANIVLCSHVMYTVTPVAPFVEKMIEKATARVIALLNERQPVANYFPLWPYVHGEERIQLPAAAEFVALLRAWGIEPEVQPLPPITFNRFPDKDAAFRASAHRLFVDPHSEKGEVLRRTLDEVLEPSEDGGLRFRWSTSNVPYVVTWKTSEPLHLA